MVYLLENDKQTESWWETQRPEITIYSGMKTEALDYMVTAPLESDCGPVSEFDFSDNWFQN